MSDPQRPLSARQIECLRRVALGESSPTIARALGLSRRTIDHYVPIACAKLGVRTRAQAVVRALSLKLIELEESEDA